jgi:hypothetical protein
MQRGVAAALRVSSPAHTAAIGVAQKVAANGCTMTDSGR